MIVVVDSSDSVVAPQRNGLLPFEVRTAKKNVALLPAILVPQLLISRIRFVEDRWIRVLMLVHRVSRSIRLSAISVCGLLSLQLAYARGETRRHRGWQYAVPEHLQAGIDRRLRRYRRCGCR